MGKSCNLTWSIVTAGYCWLCLPVREGAAVLEIHLNTGKCGNCVVCRYQVVFVTTETRNWELNVRVGSNAN